MPCGFLAWLGPDRLIYQTIKLCFKDIVKYALFFVIVVSCQPGCSVKNTQDAALSPEKELLWPTPPLKSRIKYVKSISSQVDIAIKKEKNWFTRVLDFISGGSGEKGSQIYIPYGLFFDEENNLLYIADRGVSGIHLYDLKDGTTSLLTSIEDVPLEMPVAVVLAENKVYISDTVLNKVFILTKKGKLLGEITGLQRPGGMAYDKRNQRLYVIDVLDAKVNAYDPEGNFIFSFGRRGGRNGEFYLPSNIWVDKAGNIYVSDSMNFRVQLFDENAKHIRNIGKLGDAPGSFARPRGVAVDSDGNIHVVDATFNNVQIFDQDGNLLLYYGNDGGKSGQFDLPSGIFIDQNDRIYISDSYNRRIQIFQYLKYE